jgi:hypothetical protein
VKDAASPYGAMVIDIGWQVFKVATGIIRCSGGIAMLLLFAIDFVVKATKYRARKSMRFSIN